MQIKLLIWGIIFFLPVLLPAQDSLMIDSLKNVAAEKKYSETGPYFSLSRHYFKAGDYNSAMEYIEKGLKAAQITENQLAEGNLLLLEGYIFLNWKLPNKALISFTNAKSLGFHNQDTLMIVGGFHGEGRSLIDLKQYPKAIRSLTQGLRVARDSLKTNRFQVFYNALAMAHQESNQYDTALYYFSKFYKKSKALNDSTNILYSLVNMGEVYHLKNNFDSSLYYFSAAEMLNENIHNPQADAAISGNKAQIYYQLKDYEKSLSLIKKSLEICNRNQLSKFQENNYQLIIKDYKSLNDTGMAYYYYDKFLAFKDSIYEADKISTLQLLESQHKAEQSIRNAELLDRKLKNRTTFLFLSAAASILFVLLIIVLYSRYKLRIKIHSKETKALNRTIDEKNRELVGKLLSENQELLKSSEIHHVIDDRLHHENPPEVKEALQSIKDKIKLSQTGQFNWEDFKVHFENVHPEFFDKVKEIQPKLTTNELRHCAYIRMNLATKEIARLLNVSDRAVQTARYRIKKKLDLEPDTDLINFIRNL